MCGMKGSNAPIACVLELPPTVILNRLLKSTIVARQCLAHRFRRFFPASSRLFDVGKEERDRPTWPLHNRWLLVCSFIATSPEQVRITTDGQCKQCELLRYPLASLRHLAASARRSSLPRSV